MNSILPLFSSYVFHRMKQKQVVQMLNFSLASPAEKQGLGTMLVNNCTYL